MIIERGRYCDDKLHRIDGPPIPTGDYKEWVEDGKLHRLDGPAVIDGNYREWHINGKPLSEAEFNLYTFVTAKEK